MKHKKFVIAMYNCLENPKEFFKQDFTENQSKMANLIVTILRKKRILNNGV